ncbi:MAG: hypothetical protein QXW79_01610 [Thermoplasmata archaeon]
MKIVFIDPKIGGASIINIIGRDVKQMVGQISDFLVVIPLVFENSDVII